MGVNLFTSRSEYFANQLTLSALEVELNRVRNLINLMESDNLRTMANLQEKLTSSVNEAS